MAIPNKTLQMKRLQCLDLQMKCLTFLTVMPVKNIMIKLTLNHSMISVESVNTVYKSSGYQLMSAHAKVIQ